MKNIDPPHEKKSATRHVFSRHRFKHTRPTFAHRRADASNNAYATAIRSTLLRIGKASLGLR